MIVLEDGGEKMLPWVRVEIEPGRWPGQWWFEVSYYDPDHELNGEKCPAWTHYWQKDNGGFGLWFVHRKAQDVLCEVWEELWDEIQAKKNIKQGKLL